MFKLVVVTLVVFAAGTVPAAADPVSLIVSAVNAIAAAAGISTTIATIAGTAITLGQVVAAGVLIGAGILLNSSESGSSSVDPGKAKEVFSSEASPELRAVGYARLGGLKVFGDTTGYDRYRLVAHCKGPITGTVAYYLGDREVIVEADGTVSSPPWPKSGGSYCVIKEDNGADDKTAWADLISAFPTLWTAEHRVRGIAQSLVKYVSPGVSNSKYLKLYSGGAPDLEKVVRGEAVFDPRVAGQKVDDASTWTWSDNGILVAVHIARTFPEFSASEFNWVRIAAEADRADALVATKTGTEKRSRCWGVWSSETKRGELMESVLRSIGGEFIDTGEGLAIVLVDDIREAEIDIATRHIITATMEAGPESVERPNVCVVKYYSPERDYELSEIDMSTIGWARVDSEVSATGVQEYTFEAAFCPSASQAQRLARRAFALERADRWNLTTNMVGLIAWGARMASFTPPDLDEVILGILSPPRVDDTAATVEVPLKAWPELEPWEPSTMEATAPTAIPDIPLDSALDRPAAPTGLSTTANSDGTYQLTASYALTGLSYDTIEASYRDVSDGVTSAWSSMTETATSATATLATNPSGRTFEVRLRIFKDDDSSNWSPSLTATLPADVTSTETETA